MKKYIVWIGIGVIVLFLVVSAAVAYTTQGLDPVSLSFKRLYPSMMAGSKFIPVADTDEYVSVAMKADPNTKPAQAIEAFVEHLKSEVLLSDLNISIPSDAVSDEYNFYTKGNEAQFAQLVSEYFSANEKLFTDFVVYPAVVEAYLRMKYNSDFGLNSEAYAKAKEALNRLDAGEKFEDVAKAVSDDKQTASLGGDLGFFEHSQILPELEKQIVVSPMGKHSDILITRNGYEIVLPVELAESNGQKTWHAKHILIQTAGFEDWLGKQTADISVRTFKRY